MNPTNVQLVGTILFVCAVLHTFFVSKFEHLAHKYPKGSIGENVYHFLGEVEAVFGMWAAIFIAYMASTEGLMVFGEDGHTVVGGAIKYL
ncbi:putative Na+/H+ antiporter, partial [Halobacteriovorax sp.]|uniref:putative Na+/H+ antiporter n=1 Tax=Halobacteriovorax sp. TaxID=2020862 RepID=UPI003565742F